MRLIIFFLLSSICAFSQNKDNVFFTNLSNEKFDAMLQKDTVKLKDLLHPSLVYIHSSGKKDTRSSLIENLFNSKNPYKRFELTNITTNVTKNTAFVYANLTVDYAIDTSKNSNLLITEVYIKKKKKWLLISRHANKMM